MRFTRHTSCLRTLSAAAGVGLLLATTHLRGQVTLRHEPADARAQSEVPPSGSLRNETDLDQIVARSVASAETYRKIFRNLAAEETKVIEQFKDSGEVGKRRQIMSDVLVYQSSRDGKDTTTEYRDVRSVDGKPVNDRSERALKLLTNASKAKSIEKELEAINREGERYDLGNRLRGLTINQWIPPAQREYFHVEQAGREQIAGRDVVVLAYRQTAPVPGMVTELPLPSELRGARILSRGRVWLDAETGELWRSVWELVVPHPAVPDPLVMIRSDSRYQSSRFGIPGHEHIVFDALLRFSHPKNGPPAFNVSLRATYTYGTFRRFDVTTEETIGK